MKGKIFLSFVLFLSFCVLVSGCSKRLQKVTIEKGTSPGMQEEQVTAPPSPSIGETAGDSREKTLREETVMTAKDIDYLGSETTNTIGLQDIFFDFDEAVIKDEAISTLQSNAAWLKANTKVKIYIQGHADERGNTEYNLALGEKRAQALKKYLISLGVDPKRISIISYGEERPFCIVSNEECWKQNRRGHFVKLP